MWPPPVPLPFGSLELNKNRNYLEGKMMSKKRFPYIDLIKGIAIFMVITLHNNTWHTD